MEEKPTKAKPQKETECVWHSPTEATLTITKGKRKQIIEIKLTRPNNHEDFLWLLQGVFNYRQLMNKGLTSIKDSDYDDDGNNLKSA